MGFQPRAPYPKCVPGPWCECPSCSKAWPKLGPDGKPIRYAVCPSRTHDDPNRARSCPACSGRGFLRA